MTTDKDSSALSNDDESDSASPLLQNQNATSNAVPDAGKQELHKPPILLFLLPLVVIIAYAALTR